MTAKDPFYEVSQKFEKEPTKVFGGNRREGRKYISEIKGSDIDSFFIGWMCERGSFFAYLYKFMKNQAKNNRSLEVAEEIAQAGFPIILPQLKKVMNPNTTYAVVPIPSRHHVSEAITQVLIDIINNQSPGYKLTYAPIIKKDKLVSLKEIPNWREKNSVAEGLFLPRKRQSHSGQSAILVDDIVTSGASMRACAKILTSIGYKKVIAVSLATNMYYQYS